MGDEALILQAVEFIIRSVSLFRVHGAASTLCIGSLGLAASVQNTRTMHGEADRTMAQEFKEFVLRGNVVELAVGVIIGGAFNRLVDSLVKDVRMPPIGLMLGGVDFGHLHINLGSVAYASLEEEEEACAPLIKYGAFIHNAVDFLIIASALFVAIKAINKLKCATAGIIRPRRLRISCCCARSATP